MKKGGLITCIIVFTGLWHTTWCQGRKLIPFNDHWQFSKAEIKKPLGMTGAQWQPVTVPHTWNNRDMQAGKNYYAGDAYYKKTFWADSSWNAGNTFIRFEGVGQVAEVYLNDRLIGTHKGAFSAFCIELATLRFTDSNTLVVKVNNEPREDIIPINHSLFGVYGGIYRPVSLIVTAPVHITTTDYASPGIYIRQKKVSAAAAEINVTAKLENRTRQPQQVVLETVLLKQDGQTVQTTRSNISLCAQGMQSFEQNFTVRQPHLWNGLQDPYLYKVVVHVLQNGQEADQVSQPLGIRSFTIEDGKGFYLNGQPYRLFGVTRHQDWWGYGSALSNAQHDSDLATIKEIGANSIRLAHYQQAEEMYAKSDSSGFLIWAEIPFVNAVSGKETDNAKQQYTELIRQNFNHPSIYAWGMHNEVYESAPGGMVSTLTQALHNIGKTEDPDRYTGSVNGYGKMDRSENGWGDIQGMNRYYGWYEGKTGDLEKWLTGLESNYPHHKVVLSEYGADGNILQQSDSVPEKTDPVSGQFFPEQAETRMHEQQWGIIARHPYLVSSYVWNMFDFAVPLWSRGGVPARNMKGLVSFDRQTKKDVFYWYKANWSKLPVLYISDRRLVHRSKAETTITVYSNTGTPELTLNGKKLPAPSQGTTAVHFLFTHVQLQPGSNTIHVSTQQGANQYNDEVQWWLDKK